jgi:hypothetical protein
MLGRVNLRGTLSMVHSIMVLPSSTATEISLRNHRYLPLARMSADDGEGSSVVEAGGQSQPGPVQDRVWDFPSLTF